MSLTKRQKQRLKKLSRMIDSTITIRDDMVDINLEYAREIEEIISKLISPSKTDSQPESAELSTNIQEKEPSDSRQTADHTGEHQTEANYEPPPKHVDNVPSWAKALWKKIAMKCHPDRLNFQKLSALEIAKRQHYMLESRPVYEQADWKKLLHIGIQIDEYVEELLASKQLSMLEIEYNEVTQKVNNVQNSLAWQWGNNWDNFDIKTKIIIACCKTKGIKVPSREEILDLIIKFESE